MPSLCRKKVEEIRDFRNQLNFRRRLARPLTCRFSNHKHKGRPINSLSGKKTVAYNVRSIEVGDLVPI